MLELSDPRAQGLRSMKRLAALLFAFMCALFILSLLLQEHWPGFRYLKAAAEGGMVGALADWFAVTALFRHPWGLKIPHTNLIQRKKDELGSSLGSFVQENFLSPAVISQKLRQAQLPAKVGGYLGTEQGAAAVASQVAAACCAGLELLDDEHVLTVLQALAQDYMVEPEWSSTLGTLGQKLVADGHHEGAIELLAQRSRVWVDTHPEVFTQVVADRSPSWVPRVVGGLLAQKIHQELGGLLTAVSQDQHHPLRLAVTEWLAAFTRDMQHDPATIAKVEQFKHSLLNDQQLRELAVRGWGSLKAGLLESLRDPDSALCSALRAALADFGARLLADPTLRSVLEEKFIAVAAHLTAEHGDALAELVSDTIQGWDPVEASEKLELQVGRDLQFIRINGTVIGALAGAGIYTAGELILLAGS